MITLLDKTVLLQVYIQPTVDARYYKAQVKVLLSADLVHYEGDDLRVTPRGKVLCEAIRALALPITTYVMP